MPANVIETGPFERTVKFELSDEQIAAGKAITARKLANEIKVKGFRPGKAPMPVVEATVGKERLRQEAIDDLVPVTLNEVLTENDIRPAVSPQLESLEDTDGGVAVEVKVTLWPTIDLPEYRNRSIEVQSPVVTDEDIETQTVRMLEQFATVEEVERPAKEGDFVSVDVEATSADGPIEETKASDLLYEVGSGLFIDGLDEKLIGAGAGDVVELDAPLPDGFGDRAGEEVSFKVTVNEVKERVLPDLDDTWIDENTEFETLEEFQIKLKESLDDAKLQAVSREFAEKALQTLVAQIDIELPDQLIRSEMDDLLHSFIHRLEGSELTLDDYFRVSGITQEAFLEDLRSQANSSIRNQLVLEAVAKDAEIEITAEDMSGALQSLAARSDDPIAYLKAFRDSGQELALASDILRNRALDVILTNASAVDENGNPVDLNLKVNEVEAEVVESDESSEPVPVGIALEEEE